MATDGPGETKSADDLAWERRVERRQERRRQVMRRRRIAMGAFAALVAIVVVVVVLAVSGGGSTTPGPRAANAGDHTAPALATLPRGGRRLLPGHLIVAYYGIVGTSNVLGENRDPDKDAAGVERQARAYDGYGVPVQPAFELVTTIASSDPGPFGTYSTPISPTVLRSYLRAAHRHKLLLVLDFQPGRGEFLPEVKRYAKILKDPSVGVALDPEWKLGPTQVPDQVIGSASAASINAVSAYLSKIVAADHLPQKLFIVHEFRLSELPDRDEIVRRQGLASVLQMDGLGPVAVKLHAYHQVERHAQRFYPGFKVFLGRENDPRLMPPRRVMKLKPRPAYVSYQ